MNRIALFGAVGAITTTLVAGSALACCMVPRTYKGTIAQDTHEAVLIHDGEREELVLRIGYKLSGPTAPSEFAWIVTVPNEPDAYALADKALFKDMFKLSERYLRPRSKSETDSKSRHSGKVVSGRVELGKAVTVGPYAIQPVRALGLDALKGLNAWLAKNGFPSEDEKHMAYFVQNKFTFLCVKVQPAKDQTLSMTGKLPPLHLSFKSKTPYYPLRFSSRQGVFNVNLHVLTRTKLDYAQSKNMLDKINWSNRDFRRNEALTRAKFPLNLWKVFQKGKVKSTIETRWYYNNLRSTRTNLGNAISRWEQDVFLNTPSKPEFFQDYRTRRPRKRS